MSNALRIPFAEWLYRMYEGAVPYQARSLAIYAVAFKITSNEELACLVGMDTKGVADKTYNKWKRYLSDNGWVIVKQITVGRQTTVEIHPAFHETPVTFTDVVPKQARKFYDAQKVTITGIPAVTITDETVKVTDEIGTSYGTDVGITIAAKESFPQTPFKENNKPTDSKPVGTPVELASLNGSAEPMLQDIIRWMVGGDEQSARNWLAKFIQINGQEITRDSYLKLSTDILSGTIVPRPLQTWGQIATRLRQQPRGTNGDAKKTAREKRDEMLDAAVAKVEAQNKRRGWNP